MIVSGYGLQADPLVRAVKGVTVLKPIHLYLYLAHITQCWQLALEDRDSARSLQLLRD